MNNFTGGLKNWIRNSLGLKIFFTGFLVLVLLIPTLMIEGLVRERKYTSRDAQIEVSQKWGLEQSIAGPILTVPYKEFYNRTNFNTRFAHFLPDMLNIKGDLDSEIRSRGIFEVPLYTTDLNINGSFSLPNFSELNVASSNVLWDQAYLSFGITDMRGLKEQLTIDWNEEALQFQPGLSQEIGLRSGLNVPIRNLNTQTLNYPFSLNLVLNGSQEVRFAPLGRETNILLSSDWCSPSFDGAFLPIEHDITDEGFTARWKVLDLNRNYPQLWNNKSYQLSESLFGLKFLMPVDTYQQTTRSIKYAVLFIVLTFLTFFLIEVLNRVKIHPIQYLLVGFSIVLFYLLLLSLSEHLNFNLSYVLASLGIIGLVSSYTAAILHKKAMALLLFVVLTGLYVYLYVLLQLQDYSLLLGSLGLFLILASVMFLTRKVDWYSIGNRQ